jgi:thiol-disulfide isomerase/thioredoxin
MNRYFSVALCVMLVMLLSACDEIAPPYKQSGGVVVVTGEQKVLIEDFTGFRCGNCPAAADIANNLYKAYKGKLIVLGIHSGPTFASPRGKLYSTDFRTTVGEELFNTFLGATGGQPNGMVNRAGDGNKIIAPDGWSAQVAAELEKEFVSIALPVNLIGMNSDLMCQYIEYVADRLLGALGSTKIYGAKNPFDFMVNIAMENKGNFFETRIGAYQKAGVSSNPEKSSKEFRTDEDF